MSAVAVRPDSGGGALLAAAGVLAFSFSFPATAWALDGLGPWTAFGVRNLLAGLLAAVCLIARRVPLPERRHWPALAVVCGGCVIGFPLLVTLALRTSTTAHTAVVVGLLPPATAVFAAALTGRRPSWVFWAAAGTGAAVVAGFALEQNGGVPTAGDAYLFAALVLCAAGYAQGGRLASVMPGWQVIAWADAAALPVSAAVTACGASWEPLHLTAKAAAGVVYIAAVSQFGGYVLWYRAMALAGVARAGQIQLMQPLLTLVWSVLLLGERLPSSAPVVAVAVLGCVAVTQRARS